MKRSLSHWLFVFFLLPSGFWLLASPELAVAQLDTITVLSPISNDTIGGRTAGISFRLDFISTPRCTVVIEYDTNELGAVFDSITVTESFATAAQGFPDTTATLATDTSGLTYIFKWNVRTDLPDTRIPNARLRFRVWDALNGDYFGDTTLDTLGIRTVLADPPDTKSSKTFLGLGTGSATRDSVMLFWKGDTYDKYYTVWRDTGYPPNDTERFINVTRMVTGDDSKIDQFYYSADWNSFLLIDTHVDTPPASRTSAALRDTYWLWYVTAIDTWGNVHERQYGYGDSLPCEFIYATKRDILITTAGKDTGDTKPGASIFYQITVSNTEGYSPAYSVRIIDFIPEMSDYKGTSIDIDTLCQFIPQTDIIDTDLARYVVAGDSFFVQIDLDSAFPRFDAGDTARIRFRTVIR